MSAGGCRHLSAATWRRVSLALLCWCHQCWCFWAFRGDSCSLRRTRRERAPLQYRPRYTQTKQTGGITEEHLGSQSGHAVHDDSTLLFDAGQIGQPKRAHTHTKTLTHTTQYWTYNTENNKQRTKCKKHWQVQKKQKNKQTCANVHSDVIRSLICTCTMRFWDGLHHEPGKPKYEVDCERSFVGL